MVSSNPQSALGNAQWAPALFVSHGSPMVALEQTAYTRALGAFGRAHPVPLAIAVVSAHFRSPLPIRVTSNPHPPLIYDFGGFPRALYELQYPCPGSPELACQIVRLLSEDGIPAREDPRRGLDHGAWVALRHLYPSAEVPVVEMSQPHPSTPEQLLAMGRALAPLREQGVLFVGSGGLVHNLALARLGDEDAPVDDWARAFDAWVWERLRERDLESLRSYRSLGPHAEVAVPESEHFDPLFFVLGSSRGEDQLAGLHEGFQHGNLSMRTFALGA